MKGKIECDIEQLLSCGRSTERGVAGRYIVTLSSYCLVAGEQREVWSGRYNVTLCVYCLVVGEQREEWRGRYVTL